MRRALDQYFTPRPLADAVWGRLAKPADLRGARVLEPSAGAGAFLRPPVEAGADVTALDVDPTAPALVTGGMWRGVCADFLTWETDEKYDYIVGNPPYSSAEAHVRRALDMRAPGGVVVFLLRVSFLASRRRLALFDAHPCDLVPVVPRPSFTGGGTDASEYALFVWGLGGGTLSRALVWG